MNVTIEPLTTHPAPAGRPQPIAFHEGAMWLGCWDDSKLYRIDAQTWTVQGEVQLPGMPYGVASLGGALHVVVSIGEADDRYIYRVVPGEPLDEAARIACPDFAGSHLTSDGTSLYLVQQTHRRMLELNAGGSSKREFAFPTRCAGVAFKGAAFFMIAADAEFDVLDFARFELDVAGAQPEKLASMNVEARGLAFDGSTWWTSYRELNHVVSFGA